jgi:hypothetical protein
VQLPSLSVAELALDVNSFDMSEESFQTRRSFALLYIGIYILQGLRLHPPPALLSEVDKFCLVCQSEPWGSL